jgi:hypothetical protein
VKTTLVPSLFSVAECQYEKFGSDTASSRTGFTGSEIPNRMPFALAGAGGQTELGIRRDLVAGVGVGQGRGGQEPEIFQLARHIDADQRVEISRMKRLLAAPQGS